MYELRLFHFRHPSDTALVQYLDQELSDEQAIRISSHLEDCLSCQSRVDEYRLCGMRFQQYREMMLNRFGDPPQEFRNFGQLLAAQRRELICNHKSRYQGILDQFINCLGWVGSTPIQSALAVTVLVGTIMVAVCCLLFRGGETVSAKEALHHAEMADSHLLSSVTNPVVHQRIAIHIRGKTSEWEIWRAAKAKKTHAQWGATASSRQELERIYQTNHLDVEQPLSARGFNSWRASLSQRNEHVNINTKEQLLQISTKNEQAFPGQIEEMDLIVRQEDWHPVSEIIRVQGSTGSNIEYSLQEISYAVLPMDQVPAAILASIGAIPATPGTMFSSQFSLHAAYPSRPSELQLLKSEVELSEALHRLGADTQEAPLIHRKENQIQVELWTEDKHRRDAIEEAMKCIPYVTMAIPDAERTLNSEQTKSLLASAPHASYLTTPPLVKELWKYSGGVEEANNHIAAISDTERVLFAEVAALNRLSREYPEEKWKHLSPRLQESLNSIVFDHVNAIQRESKNYFALLSPVLDAMLAEQRISSPTEAHRHDCFSWRVAANQIQEDLPQLQLAFRRSFIEDHVESAMVNLSAEQLLKQSSTLRIRVQSELRALRDSSVHNSSHTTEKD